MRGPGGLAEIVVRGHDDRDIHVAVESQIDTIESNREIDAVLSRPLVGPGAYL